jgi:hypothetical protein
VRGANKMMYWFILGIGLFLCSGAYDLLNGAKLVQEDIEIQKRKPLDKPQQPGGAEVR